jgi:inorganic phosphate transporter, PiT family
VIEMETKMSIDALWIAVPVLILAWANGANDVSKGVAALLGSGLSHAKKAILWGTGWTVLGGLAAVAWGAALVQTFGNGFLAPGFPLTLSFVTSALTGAFGWVLLSTRLGWPVSTTHALLGGIVGAALTMAGPAGLELNAVTRKALLLLLVSPLIAILLCGGVLAVSRAVVWRIPPWRPGCCPREAWHRDPFVCATGPVPPHPVRRLWVMLHWLSGGATSFARGLNDVPKIAAFLVLAMAPGASPELAPQAALGAIALVTLVMGLGSLWGGFRVLHVLANRVTAMDPAQGLVANAGTSLLVLAASPLGLPVSTTHVSTGALMGIRFVEKRLPRQADALRAILFAWVVTLPVAAMLAAATALLMGLASSN